MAEVIVLHNQADDLATSNDNLPARAIGWVKALRVLNIAEDLGEGDVGGRFLIPSLVGQGMGRRVVSAAHGLVAGTALRLQVVGGAAHWALAQSTTDKALLATHLVVSVVDANTFDVAQVGAWALAGLPLGDLYLSDTTPGALTATAPTAHPAQRVGIFDGSGIHLTIAPPSGDSFDIDVLVTELNDREDLNALPKGAAGGDLTGFYPNPLVNELSGLGTTFKALSPTWKSNGQPFTPTNQVESIAFKSVLGPAILVDRYGQLYHSADGGLTWTALGYSVSSGGTTRDIAYGKVDGVLDGWAICGESAIHYFVDVAGNYDSNGLPLQSAWVHVSVTGNLTDIGWCAGQARWVWQEQDLGFWHAASLAGAAAAPRVVPTGAAGATGGIFEEVSTGRCVYFERSTGRVWWSATMAVASSWVEVLKDSEPVLKAIYPGMSEAAGVGSGVSLYDTSAFAGAVVIATTDVSNPDRYMMAEETGRLPSLWDITTDGHRWIGSTFNNAAPVLYRLFLGSIPAHRQIVAEKGLAVYGPTELVDLPDAEVLGTDKNGVVTRKTLGDLGGISQVLVSKGGAAVGGGKTLNFIQGANVTLSIVDQGDVIDVTVASTGGGGGGGGSSGAKYASTMTPALALSAQEYPNSGGTGTSNWTAHGTLMVPESDITLTPGSSKLAMLWSNQVADKQVQFAIYEYPDGGGPVPLVGYTAQFTMTSGSSYIDLVWNSSAVTLVGGERYYFVMLTNSNGGRAMGQYSYANLNIQPYRGWYNAHVGSPVDGSLTTPPDTITPEGEHGSVFFGRCLA